MRNLNLNEIDQTGGGYVAYKCICKNSKEEIINSNEISTNNIKEASNIAIEEINQAHKICHNLCWNQLGLADVFSIDPYE